ASRAAGFLRHCRPPASCRAKLIKIYFSYVFCRSPLAADGRHQMRLTLHTDYALRVLIYVGLKKQVLSTIPELVGPLDIPKGHVMQVVHRLAQLGYLRTTRGKKGGMRLAREAAEINVGAVVRDMERELGVVGCLQGSGGYCRIEGCCVLQQALREATG